MDTIRINRLHAAYQKLNAIVAQLDELLNEDPCGCGECEICHSLPALTNDLETLAKTCLAEANARSEWQATLTSA